MKKAFFRITTMALCLIMCVSLLPVTSLADDGVAINENNFPDKVFRDYVKTEFDTDKNGSLSAEEIAGVTKINVADKGVKSLQGVEFFTGLKNLTCYNSDNIKYIESLDLSKNTALEVLDCAGNWLEALDISHNPELRYLICDGNYFPTLDISNNPHLINAYRNARPIEYSGPRLDYNIDFIYRLMIYPGTKVYTLPAPVITTSPTSVKVTAGDAATFAVAAEGQDLTYQWFVQKKSGASWTEVSGGTSAELTVSTKASMDGWKYRCKVRAGNERAKSSAAATLTVLSKPAISTQPAAVSVKAGKTATCKVKASGGELKYQWYVMKAGSTKWAKLSGKTSANLKLTAKKSMNGYKYRCLVYNELGKVYTKAVKLTVKK